MDLAPDPHGQGRLRPDDVRSGVHQHRIVPQRHHLHRRRQGHPRVPRLSHRATRREEHLPRDGVPADLRRTAERPPARAVDARHQVLNDGPREHQEVHRRLQLRLPSRWACSSAPSARSRRTTRTPKHRRSGFSRAADLAPYRQDADDRRLRLSPQPRAAVRLSGQRPVLRRQLPQHALEDVGGEVHARSRAGAGDRCALHPACRPRAELQRERHARRRQLAA